MSQWDELNILPKRFIDMRNSELDKEKSDPEKNIYVFKSKVYYDKTDNKFPHGYLPYWGRKTQNLHSAGRPDKLVRFGWFPLNIKEHQVLPEPFAPQNIDENGNFVYVDGILGSIPYEKLTMKRWREVSKGHSDLKSKFSQFDDMLKEAGAEMEDSQREKFDKMREEALGF